MSFYRKKSGGDYLFIYLFYTSNDLWRGGGCGWRSHPPSGHIVTSEIMCIAANLLFFILNYIPLQYVTSCTGQGIIIVFFCLFVFF